MSCRCGGSRETVDLLVEVAADMAELAKRTATVYYDLDNGLPPL